MIQQLIYLNISDATYREKYSGNVGYVANLVESFNEDNGVITHYDLKPNTYSDVKFCEDLIDTLGETSDVNVLVDGAYYSYELDEKAKKQGIMLKPGQLVGKAPAQDKLPYSSFEVDEETQKITSCPNKEILQISYSGKNSYIAKFKDEQCEKCPLRNQCPAKKEKKGILNTTSLLNSHLDTFIGKNIELIKNVNKSIRFTTLKTLVFVV